MNPLAITLVLSLVAIISFAWSVFGAFRAGEKLTSGYDTLKISVVSVWLIQIYVIYHAVLDFGSPNYWAGNLLVLLSLWLFWHCVSTTKARKLTLAFSVDSPEHIYRVGPYGYVRHPFYLSYLMAYYGMAIATNNLWLYLAALVMTFLYYYAARFEERKFAASHLSHHYAEYRRSTGMFLPRIPRVNK